MDAPELDRPPGRIRDIGPATWQVLYTMGVDQHDRDVRQILNQGRERLTAAIRRKMLGQVQKRANIQFTLARATNLRGQNT